MKPSRLRSLLALSLGIPALQSLGIAAENAAPPEARAARLTVRASLKSPHPIPPFITGKFAEHLGNNIYNGMDAQILRNPTFAAFPFATGQQSPDGVATFLHERDRISQAIRQRAQRDGWPEAERESLAEAYFDGLAAFWGRLGPRADVSVSPDVGSHGGRAQRVEVRAAGQGVRQWCWLPLHRLRHYEFEVYLRSPNIPQLAVRLDAGNSDGPSPSAEINGVSGEWKSFRGRLQLPESIPADQPCRFELAAAQAGQFVVGRVRLWPADHVAGHDPEVIRLLQESHLPLLRWPGGNFVSGYHWEDGVGPIEHRPTHPNFAWGSVEPNLFGTDEFIAFCRAVGCEPMICVNAGDGSPEEAARWVEYCNGSAGSPMGQLRAANGHREPFRVRHWEVGNELWGRWQFYWTTASGYADRYRRFAQAMRAADPTIQLYACGAPVFWGKAWNDTLIAAVGPELPSLTDHPLIGGNVTLTAGPLEVFHDFMAVPGVLEQKWAALREDLIRGGVSEPRLAVTELQLFAHLGPRGDPNLPVRLTRENLPAQGSITEALYDILVYHAAVRLQPFVEMVTHSATVNHGGGLRKERERVYANPCHYAQADFAALAGAFPVAIELDAPAHPAPLVLPELRNVLNACQVKAVDALAAVAPNGDLLLSLVNTALDPIRISIQCDDFPARGIARCRHLGSRNPWDGNSLEQPDAVIPREATVPFDGGTLNLELTTGSVTFLRVSK